MAERKVQRARLNGVENPGIYYSEAVLMAMRGEPTGALLKLQKAYELGFRERWLLSIDGRLDSLRDREEFVILQNQLNDDVSSALAEVRSVSLAAL